MCVRVCVCRRGGGGWMGDVTVPNRFMHLYRNGTIYYSMRCVCGVVGGG